MSASRSKPLRSPSAPSGKVSESARLYAKLRATHAQISGSDGKLSDLPTSLSDMLRDLVASLSKRQSVSLVQTNQTVTTSEAARRLGVSRQFLVDQLERGDLAFHKVGTHRRIYLSDLLAYQARRDARRRKILDGIAQAELAEVLYDRVPLNVRTR